MEHIYLLEHTHVYSEDNENTKTIGIYTTEEEALPVIEELKSFSGFIKYPQGFNIDKYKIDQTFWKEGCPG